MKVILFIVCCCVASAANSQSLKEALYGGRLKNDSGTVVKKGDTTRLRDKPVEKPVETVKPETVAGNQVPNITVDAAGQVVPADPATVAAPAKDNNKLWKEFIEEYSAIIKSEVLTSKKVKPGTYSVLIEYEIGIDGNISTVNVSASPESDYLVEQIKLRMMYNAPQLTPALNANGKPRVASKKQMLTFSKEKD